MPLQCGLLNLCTLASCASLGWEQFMKFSDTLMSTTVTFCVMSLADSKHNCFEQFLRLENE